MVRYIKGNLWDSNDSLIAISTNSTLKSNGCLVMGAGVAKQARDMYTGVDKKAGDVIIKYFKSGEVDYGFFTLFVENKLLGFFQTKVHYTSSSSYTLISRSCESMLSFLVSNSRDVSMNFPGIGYGNLQRLKVKSILDYYFGNIPELLTIYEK